jgi:hypothetical protein
MSRMAILGRWHGWPKLKRSTSSGRLCISEWDPSFSTLGWETLAPSNFCSRKLHRELNHVSSAHVLKYHIHCCLWHDANLQSSRRIMETKHIITRTIHRIWKIRYYRAKEMEEYRNVFQWAESPSMAKRAKEKWYIPTQSMLVDLVYKVLLCILKSISLSSVS